ncbi:MAG TPA: ATP-binding protein [Gemmataceae bacterium]|nr:ATP-binding protein [Gemmataceae bacterium]
MPKAIDYPKLLQSLQNPQVPPETRADLAIFTVAEHGMDARAALAQLIREADEGRAIKAKAEEEEGHPLSVETFVARSECLGRTFAVVTSAGSDLYVPCKPQEIEELVAGDAVLVDPKSARIVGRDGALPPTGDVVTVENVPDPRHVVVRHHDQLVKARLAQRFVDAGTVPVVGARVVYNPASHFVNEVIDTESDGEELLTDPSALAHVSRADLGAPHPILDEMLFRVKMWVRQPEWMTRMSCRPRTSYLLVGSTGTGKTMHLKVLARELTDFVEELTGCRTSRLVLCDASSFYNPLFGQTELNVNRWFERLSRLGRAVLRGRDGREVRVPLLVVLEEAEALLRMRGEVGGSGHLFDRPLAQILQKLDALTDHLNVPLVFCATTNRADLLDPAALRRLGVSPVIFGTLSAGQAASVLAKKILPNMPLRNAGPQARQTLMNQAISYLYGNDPDQGLAEVRLRNGERRTLSRRDLVTPAALETAVSSAIDDSLRQSAEVGRLLGLDGEAIVQALHAHFANLATTLRPHNLREHCPEWFTGDPIHVEEVRPLVRRMRRPRFLLVRDRELAAANTVGTAG